MATEVEIAWVPSPSNRPAAWRVTDRAGVRLVLDLLRPWLCARRCARGEEILRLQAAAMQTTPQPRRNGGRFMTREQLAATMADVLGEEDE
jgi:hypothetical protein